MSRLVYCKTKKGFEDNLKSEVINTDNVVFIEETQEIWTHGNTFSSLKSLLQQLDTKQTALEAGDNITLVLNEDTGKYIINAQDTTYQLSLQDDLLLLSNTEGVVINSIDLSSYKEDTKNTTGALETSDKIFLVGASEQTESSVTNTSSIYAEGNGLYTSDGQAFVKEQSLLPIKEALKQLEEEIANIDVKKETTYCIAVRYNGDIDPTVREYVGNKDSIKTIASHLKMAAVVGQGDYTILSDTRIDKSAAGRKMYIDGSDGDIVCATDTKMYIYTEKIAVDNTYLEVIGISLTPFTLYGKEATGYDPFAFACDVPVFSHLNSENTARKTGKDTKGQLHCIYNTNVHGQYNTPSGIFSATYKSNGIGYSSGDSNNITAIMRGQERNTNDGTNYPYIGLYYRFLEIWIAAAIIELGTHDVTSLSLLGTGMTSASIADATTFNSNNISANSGVKIITNNNNKVYYESLVTRCIKKTVNDAEFVSISSGLDFSDYGCSVLPIMLGQRFITNLTAKNNLTNINNPDNIFLEDGSITTGVNVETGEGMVEGTRYFIARDCPGAQSFTDNVMTGVINCYVKMPFTDGAVYGKSSISLTSAVAIFKFSIPMYRGWTWSTGHSLFITGFHYVTVKESGKDAYVKGIYQKDPKSLPVYKYTTEVISTSSSTQLAFEQGYESSEEIGHLYGFVTESDPSVSLLFHTAVGGGQHTHVCSVVQNSNTTLSGYDSYRFVSASNLGGNLGWGKTSFTSISGLYFMDTWQSSCAGSFSIIDYQG